jgi:hypothetical protein
MPSVARAATFAHAEKASDGVDYLPSEGCHRNAIALSRSRTLTCNSLSWVIICVITAGCCSKILLWAHSCANLRCSRSVCVCVCVCVCVRKLCCYAAKFERAAKLNSLRGDWIAGYANLSAAGPKVVSVFFRRFFLSCGTNCRRRQIKGGA